MPKKKNIIQKLTKKLDDYEPYIKKIDDVKCEYPFAYYLFQAIIYDVSIIALSFINNCLE